MRGRLAQPLQWKQDHPCHLISLIKGTVNTSTRGEVGAVVGGGFYW
ncbi:hypothetical protein K6V72_16630 [Ralstonia insidiosa]|nr:hypothetical protein [Ralstonia insidiosa]MBY4910640.1 hypothetical protein [Ralstonia insidiosa]